MPIQMQCPQCQAKAALPNNHAGRPVRCKVCKATFTIPIDAGANPDQPTVIDRYLVRELLGEGSFGSVYRAFDPRLERDVALKVLRPQMMSSAQAVERFLREAKSAAKLLHPNIVPVHDAGRSGSIYYIASAFIKGMTLASAIPEEGGIEPRRAVILTAQLATALGYAHRQGILHRDVKPANAMLNEQESLHLMDFGLAGWTQAESTRLTRLGAVMGTPAYMAPEQASGDTKNVGPAADLYSAGVVLYELLTSRLPFDAGHPAALGYLVVHTAPTPPSQHKPGLDAGLEAICLKAMAKKPEDRFASGEEMAAALTDWTPAAPHLVPPMAMPSGTRQTKPTTPPMARSKATISPLTPVSHKETILPLSGRPAARRPSVFDRETVMPASPKRSTLGSPPAARTRTGSRQRGDADNRRNLLLGGVILLAVVGVLLLVMLSWPSSPKPRLNVESANSGKKRRTEPPIVSQPDVETKADSQAEIPLIIPPQKTVDPPPLQEETQADEITNGIGMKLKLIKEGTFKMGSPQDEKGRFGDEGPLHEVEITRPFYMGVYPVTRGQFAAFVKDASYKTDAETDGRDPARAWWKNLGFLQTDEHPVVNVSWNDAVKFCEWLSQKENKSYILPTEAQWEYACRAGTTTAYSFGEDFQMLDGYAWYRDNSGLQTHPVGGKTPNRWGLYDMHGNVGQWCADYYDDKYYQNSSNKDPQNTLKTNAHVSRGGSWYKFAGLCRAAYRSSSAPDEYVSSVGLRVVMRPAETPTAANPTPAPAADPVKVDPPVAPTPEEKLADEITNGVGMKLKLIKAGKFLMGSPNSEVSRDNNEGPQHEVEITRPFYMGAYPVTRGQFAAFVKDAAYKTEAETSGKGGWGYNATTGGFEAAAIYTWRNPWRYPGIAQTDDHPVVQVSWNDAMAFCTWLSKKEGKTYELPTEAEWEYACRAGTKTRFWCGDADASLKGNANIAEASAKATWERWPAPLVPWNDGYGFTSPVDKYNANPWGLYDMHGNIHQLCADRYGPYQEGAIKDPKGNDRGNIHVMRGGSWFDHPQQCRSAKRGAYDSVGRLGDLGFRVVFCVPAQTP